MLYNFVLKCYMSALSLLTRWIQQDGFKGRIRTCFEIRLYISSSTALDTATQLTSPRNQHLPQVSIYRVLPF